MEIPRGKCDQDKRWGMALRPEEHVRKKNIHAFKLLTVFRFKRKSTSKGDVSTLFGKWNFIKKLFQLRQSTFILEKKITFWS